MHERLSESTQRPSFSYKSPEVSPQKSGSKLTSRRKIDSSVNRKKIRN